LPEIATKSGEKGVATIEPLDLEKSEWVDSGDTVSREDQKGTEAGEGHGKLKKIKARSTQEKGARLR